MKELSIADLKNLARGAAFLGSGGGGDTSILYPFAYHRLNNKKIILRKISELTGNDLVIPIAYVGSPAVSKATGPTEAMFLNHIKAICKQHPTKNILLMPAEIGGCNAFAPIVPAALLNFPILDADLLGRAFPKVKMCKPAITRKNQTIEFYMASREGEVQFGIAKSVDELEVKVRDIAVAFGGSGCIATYLFSGDEYQDFVIENSISNACKIGETSNTIGCNLVEAGIITKIVIENAGGFLSGFVEITQGDSVYRIDCVNEFYTVTLQGITLVESPDIISLVDVKTNLPVASESLLLGMCVNINILPAPDFWKGDNARCSVTPDQFIIS